MYDKFGKTAPRTPRCSSCAQPMQLLRRTSRFDELPDLCSFYCCACDEWHVEECEAPRGGLSDFGGLAASAVILHR